MGLWSLLMDAHKSLATLNGTGRHLPNPELVLRPLQNREAQRSSSLEGTYTDPREQMLFELNPAVPESTEDPANARREVFNYARALRLRRGDQAALPVSLRLIKDLHRTLMHGVRGRDRDPGNFRRTQTQIGQPARFVPPPITEMPRLLDNFERYLHSSHDLDPLVVAFVAHYQFEAIHPFLDGNGRVGRLLLAIVIEEWCDLSEQWLYMSEYFDRNKDRYIDLLYRVSTQGAWTEWITFCLHGVAEQATRTLTLCERLIELNRDFHDRVSQSGGSVRLSSVVDDLFITPVEWPSRLWRKAGVTYPTARSDLKKLEELGIVTEFRGDGPISYISEPILELIYDE